MEATIANQAGNIVAEFRIAKIIRRGPLTSRTLEITGVCPQGKTMTLRLSGVDESGLSIAEAIYSSEIRP